MGSSGRSSRARRSWPERSASTSSLGAGALLAGALASFSAVNATAQPPTFSDIARGGRIEIEFESRGCFHLEKREIVVHGGTHPLAEIRPDDEPGLRREGGIARLSSDDWRLLEAYVRHLRSNPTGGCTTEDRLRLTWVLPSGSVYKEHFVDASCAFMTDRFSGPPRALTPSDLIRRLAPVSEPERGSELSPRAGH